MGIQILSGVSKDDPQHAHVYHTMPMHLIFRIMDRTRCLSIHPMHMRFILFPCVWLQCCTKKKSDTVGGESGNKEMGSGACMSAGMWIVMVTAEVFGSYIRGRFWITKVFG